MAKARVAIIGAGLMGQDIAQVFAFHGHQVAIYDPVEATLKTVKSRIAATILAMTVFLPTPCRARISSSKPSLKI